MKFYCSTDTSTFCFRVMHLQKKSRQMISRIRTLLLKTTVGTLLTDMVIISSCYFLSYYLRFGGAIPETYSGFFFNSLPMVLLVKLYFLQDFKLYKGAWRYTSIYEVVSLFKATIVSSMAVVLVIWLSGLIHKIPRAVIVIDWCLSFLMLGGVRIIPRILTEGLSEPIWNYIYYFIKYQDLKRLEKKDAPRNVLIYGAGDAGQMVVREIKLNRNFKYNPLGFIDDNPEKKGKTIHGIEILGDRRRLREVVEKRNVDEIIISLPTVRRKDLKEILTLCGKTGKKTKIVPSISEIVDDKITISNIRHIKIEDLLGREPVSLNEGAISEYLRDKKVLVTGAGGSIGSELCRQIMKYQPEMLLLFGRGEHSIYYVHNELKRKYPNKEFPQIIGDVINKAKVERIFEAFRPDIVFHAGADKHVPLMEMNPDEAVLNNILGTENVIEASDKVNLQRLICISTDKAVNPTSVMGACKRVAEKLIQNRNTGETKVIGVRFGNVLGSRGSVIPLFEQQIKAGGPVTITHKDMKRFLMTIPEAAQLVIQAGAVGENGDLFVLDMGEQIRIDEFARAMIELAGLKPDEDIEIVYTGIRPGEKMEEELLYPWEHYKKTSHPKILKILNKAKKEDMNQLINTVNELRKFAVGMAYDRIYQKLLEIVPEYEIDDLQGKLHNSFLRKTSFSS